VFDLNKRIFTGISLDDDQLRIAKVSVIKDKLHVLKLQTVRLVEPVFGSAKEDDDSLDDAAEEEDGDSIFGLDDTPPAPLGGDDPDMDTWDMAEQGVSDEFRQETNVELITALLSDQGVKNANLGLCIPFGATYIQAFGDLDAKKLGKRKLLKELNDRLEALYGHPVTSDQLRYSLRPDGKILVASIEQSIPTIKLIDDAISAYSGKIFVRDVSSEELMLISMVRANYTLADHEYTCIVHTEEQSTRVLFMKGTEFHSILPVIAEGRKTTRVLRTIFSKILFEVDRGKIPTLDRIIVTGDSIDGRLTNFLAEQFMDVVVDDFIYNPEKFETDESIKFIDPMYLKAIGAAWAISGNSRADFLDLNFVPKYVQTRQQVFKLEWHGFILLTLIALVPVFFNYQYQTRKQSIQASQQQMQLLDQQIVETRTIAESVDRLMAEFNGYNTSVTLLDTLSYNALKWSRSLRMINAASENINSVWFTNFQSDGERLVLQGATLYRDRIPRISNAFSNATIQQVVEREERGIIVYEFVLLVHQIVRDESIFRPEKIRAPEDLLLLRENTTAQGVIQY